MDRARARHSLSPVQLALLSQFGRADSCGATHAANAAPGDRRRGHILGPHQSLAVAGRVRHQRRIPRSGKNSGRTVARLLQAPVAVGNLRVATDLARRGLHHEARADVDSVLWLVRLESRDDPDRSQQGIAGPGGHERVRPARACAQSPDHHLS